MQKNAVYTTEQSQSQNDETFEAVSKRNSGLGYICLVAKTVNNPIYSL